MPNATYEGRLGRLGNQLDTANSKIAEYTAKRDSILAEIQTITGGSPSAKGGNSGSGRSRTSMGDKILTFLASNPGSSMDAIASRLRVAKNQAGLSLYHLKTSNKVREDEGQYYPVTASAKGASDTTDDTE